MLVWVCGSHAANLVVEVAICGCSSKKKVESNPIQIACSTLYRHLIPDYIEEFAHALRTFIVCSLKVVEKSPPEPEAGHVAMSATLQRLYGADVLPNDLLLVLNQNLRAFEHVTTPGKDRRALLGWVYSVLHKYILRIECVPVITRFWISTS